MKSISDQLTAMLGCSPGSKNLGSWERTGIPQSYKLGAWIPPIRNVTRKDLWAWYRIRSFLLVSQYSSSTKALPLSRSSSLQGPGLSWPQYRLSISISGGALGLVVMVAVIISQAISPPFPDFFSLKNFIFIVEVFICTALGALLLLFFLELYGVAASINNHSRALSSLEFDVACADGPLARGIRERSSGQYVSSLRAHIEKGATSFHIFWLPINEKMIGSLSTLLFSG